MTRDEIESWLIERIARLAEMESHRVGLHEPMANFGLSSNQAMELSGDLEKLLRRKLEPTLVWDYPTIQELSDYLAAKG